MKFQSFIFGLFCFLFFQSVLGFTANAQSKITSLPGLSSPPTHQYSGYVGAKDAKLFYWLMAEHSPNKPLILWSNGGPAYTSLFGLFYEVGPYKIMPDLTLESRKHSWNKFANLLVIDHPANAGLSKLKSNHTAQSRAEAIDQYYQALARFLKAYPQYQSSPIYLAGESYAGTTLPLLAQKIESSNLSKGQKINLKGLILISPWSDPKVQQSMDSQYAYSHGLISSTQKKKVDRLYQTCKKLLEDKAYLKANSACGKVSSKISKLSGLTLTNITFQDRDYDGKYLAKYLNQPKVKKALHAENAGRFENYSSEAGNAFTPDIQKAVLPELNNLLKSSIPIMIISGLSDGKDTNFLGVGKMIEQLKWSERQGYLKSLPRAERVDGKVIGYIKSGGGLSWFTILNAGHPAPQDQPLIYSAVKSFVFSVNK